MKAHIFDHVLQRTYPYEISDISDVIPKTGEICSINNYVFFIKHQLVGCAAHGGVINRNDDETFSEYIERVF